MPPLPPIVRDEGLVAFMLRAVGFTGAARAFPLSPEACAGDIGTQRHPGGEDAQSVVLRAQPVHAPMDGMARDREGGRSHSLG